MMMIKINPFWKKIKVAPYSFTIARAFRTKAQVICARSKENVSVFRYFMTSTQKSKTDSEFSRVSYILL